MIVLGIESSCDETAAALVEDGRKILSSVVASQVEEHKIYGGVVPEIASRRHSEAIVAVVQEALERGRKKLSQVDAIAVTYAPGLIGALLVGVNFAKGLSLATGLPLVPVHHLRGHIASGYLSDARLEPPFLCLVASGGHSHIVQVEDYTKLKILGRTRDDAAGEAFDKAARAMGIPYPGGVEMDRIAEEGDPNAYKLPHPHVEGAPLDFRGRGNLRAGPVRLLPEGGGLLPDGELLQGRGDDRRQDLGRRRGCFRQPAAAPGAGAPGPGAGAESLPAGQAPVRGQRRHDCLPGVLRVPGGEHRRHGLKRLCPALH